LTASSITRALTAETSQDRLLGLIVDSAARLLGAERCSLYLVDLERGELWTKAAHLPELPEIRIPLTGTSLATHVARTGETINLADAHDDPRFNRDFDRQTGFRTRSMLVTPMLDRQRSVIGVVQVMNKHTGQFDADDVELVDAFAASAAVAVENAQLYAERVTLLNSFIETMAASIDAKDRQTSGHTRRVTSYAVAIAVAYGLSPADVEITRLAAQLHDYGKIAIPDAILTKSGKFTDEESQIMRMHAFHTKQILSLIRFPRYLSDIPDIAARHHERMDGRGYPWSLPAEEIPVRSRIISVADVFDALTSRRFYKDPSTIESAIATLHENAGTQFDPEVIAAFDRALPRITELHNSLRAQADNGT
jgi:HD-GYP domain-containing protein (c-di-GMP phosphodiesterase class II)